MPELKPKSEPKPTLAPSTPKRHKSLAHRLPSSSTINLQLWHRKAKNPTSIQVDLDEDKKEEESPIHSLASTILILPQPSHTVPSVNEDIPATISNSTTHSLASSPPMLAAPAFVQPISHLYKCQYFSCLGTLCILFIQDIPQPQCPP